MSPAVTLDVVIWMTDAIGRCMNPGRESCHSASDINELSGITELRQHRTVDEVVVVSKIGGAE